MRTLSGGGSQTGAENVNAGTMTLLKPTLPSSKGGKKQPASPRPSKSQLEHEQLDMCCLCPRPGAATAKYHRPTGLDNRNTHILMQCEVRPLPRLWGVRAMPGLPDSWKHPPHLRLHLRVACSPWSLGPSSPPCEVTSHTGRGAHPHSEPGKMGSVRSQTHRAPSVGNPD